MINITSAKKSELLKLKDIQRDIFNYSVSLKEFEHYFNEDAIKIWKVSNKNIIGFVSFYHVKDEIEIIQICIIKSFQRKNYGSSIINKIKKLNNVNKIFLEVSVENSEAIKFYLKNGFKKIGIRKAYYNNNNNNKIDALKLLFEF